MKRLFLAILILAWAGIGLTDTAVRDNTLATPCDNKSAASPYHDCVNQGRRVIDAFNMPSTVVTSTGFWSEATKLTVGTYIVPTGTKKLLIRAALGLGGETGWCATAYMGFGWTATMTGDTDGGDAWGWAHFRKLSSTGEIEYKDLLIGPQGATLYNYIPFVPNLLVAVELTSGTPLTDLR